MIWLHHFCMFQSLLQNVIQFIPLSFVLLLFSEVFVFSFLFFFIFNVYVQLKPLLHIFLRYTFTFFSFDSSNKRIHFKKFLAGFLVCRAMVNTKYTTVIMLFFFHLSCHETELPFYSYKRIHIHKPFDIKFSVFLFSLFFIRFNLCFLCALDSLYPIHNFFFQLDLKILCSYYSFNFRLCVVFLL